MTGTRRGTLRRTFVRSLLLAPIAYVTCSAQRAVAESPASRVRPTLRADALLDRDPAVHVGIGVSLPAAYNVRVSLDGGAGGVRRPGGWVASGRVEVLARVLTDPYRRSRWALYGGGGIGQRLERRAPPRTVAIVVVGLEGPSDGRWLPGVELGLGGGARLGVTLRRVPRNQR